MDFEFILPKLGAGPLIVPLINYSKYEVWLYFTLILSISKSASESMGICWCMSS